MQIFRWKSTEELCLMTLKSDAKFEEKLTLGSKNNMRNLVSFNASRGIRWTLTAVESLEICTLMGYFCRKYVIFELKRYRVVLCKMTYGFKNDISNLVNLHTNVHVSAEGMNFFGWSPSNFNFFWLSIACLSSSNSCNFWNQLLYT